MATLILRPISDYSISGVNPSINCYSYLDEEIADDDITYIDMNSFPIEILLNFQENYISNTISKLTTIKRMAITNSDSEISDVLIIDNKRYTTKYLSGSNSEYTTHRTEYVVSPDTNQPWQWNEVNNLIAGLYHEQQFLKAGNKITQFYIEIDYTESNPNPPLTRPFAFNSGSTISGTTQVGNIAIGSDQMDYSGNPGVGGVQWWAGPDENDRYIICVPIPAGNQPTPFGDVASIGFCGTVDKTDQSFINLASIMAGQNFSNVGAAYNWLTAQGYWTNFLYIYIGIISAGSHTLFVGENSTWSWGYNYYGQLGDNSVTNRCTPVSILGGKKTFCKVTAGQSHTVGVDYLGQVWGWGYNNYGQLGDNSITSKLTPVSILGGKKTFCNITVGQDYTVGVDLRGQVWVWGYNASGSLGDNSITSRLTPVSILGGKKTFCNIDAGQYHTIGVDYLGQVWSWGYNLRGQLGDNSTTSRRTPVSILGGKKTFCNITAGSNHTVGVDYQGQVWSWGHNISGQLGDNSITSRRTPVSILGGKKTFCQVTAGYYHTVGVDYLGQVWGWGYNNKGQLGDNSTTSRLTPVSILGGKKTFCNIDAGQYHTIGVDYLGQVWGWGDNAFGQLGDNSTTSRLTPVSILGGKKTFCNIDAGQYHTIGVDYLGQVWSWGYNNYGQLGDNSIISKLTPVSILGGKKTFCQVTAGDYHTVGVDLRGQVWSWGYNNKGQLGDNSINNRCTPVSILGGKKTFCNIDAGQYHTIGVDYLGQVWGWGYNISGQLGDNSLTSKLTPVSILGGKKTFCNISAVQYHTIGIDYLGQVWSWGYNSNGQLGCYAPYTPVRVYNL